MNKENVMEDEEFNQEEFDRLVSIINEANENEGDDE